MAGFREEDILMEDEDVCVVRKHGGMAVQSAKTGQMDLEHALLAYFLRQARERVGAAAPVRGELPYLAVIHRLDQPVEGVLVFAKNPEAARKLNRSLQQGRMEKYYLAVVCGKPEQDTGRLVDYLVKDGRSNLSRVASQHTAGAKRAELEYRVIRRIGEKKKGNEKEKTEIRTLLEIHLLTGRHHQIRVQLSHAGMPLAGDVKYGGGTSERSGEKEQLALCAYRLSFPHPRTGKRMEFCVRPEGDAFDRASPV